MVQRALMGHTSYLLRSNLSLLLLFVAVCAESSGSESSHEKNTKQVFLCRGSATRVSKHPRNSTNIVHVKPSEGVCAIKIKAYYS